MRWQIPAKTFLLGEYAALSGGSAMVLTTMPCFQLSLEPHADFKPLPQTSPAWNWWLSRSGPRPELSWHDPYLGKGGLGASSAEFIAVFLADSYLRGEELENHALFQAYQDLHGENCGLKPSGYDVLAQSFSLSGKSGQYSSSLGLKSFDKIGCIYINKEQEIIEGYDWVFEELAFLLVHSGKKLATHHHLESLAKPIDGRKLSVLAEKGREAFIFAKAETLVAAVQAYQEALAELNLTCQHSLQRIKEFKTNKKILAVKGCGAMGADVFLLLVAKNDLFEIANTGLKAGESLLWPEFV